MTLLPGKPPHLGHDQHHADDVVDIDGYHENHDQHDADEEHHREVEEFLHTHPAISEAQVGKQELALTYSLKDISIAKAAKNSLKTCCITTLKAFGVPDERMGEELAVWIKLNRWNHERVNLKTFLFHCSSAQLVFSNNNKMKIPSGASIEEAELRQFCKGKVKMP